MAAKFDKTAWMAAYRPDYNKKRLRSKEGRVSTAYHDMRARVEGRTARAEYYKGLELCEREYFIRWSLSDPGFNACYTAWAANGYVRKFAPSIDRIDTKRGYVRGNMQWILLRENSLKAMRHRWGNAL